MRSTHAAVYTDISHAGSEGINSRSCDRSRLSFSVTSAASASASLALSEAFDLLRTFDMTVAFWKARIVK